MPANITYLDSNAMGTGDGTSWANARLNLQTALGGITNSNAGNRSVIWMASDHYELSASDVTITRTGTATPWAIIPVYRVDKVTDLYAPTPKDGTDVANFETSGGSTFMEFGGVAFYGARFLTHADFSVVGNYSAFFTDCHIMYGATGANRRIDLINAEHVKFINSFIESGDIGNSHLIRPNDAGLIEMRGNRFKIRGVVTGLFDYSTSGRINLVVHNNDFSACTDIIYLMEDINNSTAQADLQTFDFENNVLPNGVLITGYSTMNSNMVEIKGIATSDATTREDYFRLNVGGVVRTSKSIYLTGGETDPVTNAPKSQSLETFIGCSQDQPVSSQDQSFAVDSGNHTFTVELLDVGSATATHADVWLEIEYYDSANPRRVAHYGQRDKLRIDTVVPLLSGNPWFGAPGGSRAISLSSTIAVGMAGLVTARVRFAKYRVADANAPVMYVNGITIS